MCLTKMNLFVWQPVFYTTRACMSLIRTEQAMYYRACKTCNKKVSDAIGSGYWCEACQKNENDCSLRFVMVPINAAITC